MHQVLDIYYRDLHTALSELLERTRQHQMNLTVRKASGFGPQFTPGSTSEEVAMQAVELASRARTIEEAMSVVAETYKGLFKRERDFDSQ